MRKHPFGNFLLCLLAAPACLAVTVGSASAFLYLTGGMRGDELSQGPGDGLFFLVAVLLAPVLWIAVVIWIVVTGHWAREDERAARSPAP